MALRAALLGILILVPGLSRGAMVTEVLSVNSRPAQELVQVLKPLIPPPGAISGYRDQLIIKTTPENLRELKRVLASIDRPLSNLLVEVRQSMNDEVSRDLQQAFANAQAGNVGITAGRRSGGQGITIIHQGDKNTVGARQLSTRESTRDPSTQSIRVLEGREAFIQTGQSVPIANRNIIVGGGGISTVDTVEFRDVVSGFYVKPRLNGDRVTVEVYPRREGLSAQGGGAIDTRSAQTVVSGPLGRWIRLGGVTQTTRSDQRGILESTQSRRGTETDFFIRVQKLN